MTRTRTPEDICAYCDEYLKAPPEYAELGMGRCAAHTDGVLSAYVEWNGRTCVSYRVDKLYLAQRREYVAKWRAKAEQG